MKIQLPFCTLILGYVLCYSSLLAQQAPFHKGINLTGWFQAASTTQIQINQYTKGDFEQIKSLGCDVIRLPINLHFMTNGSPNYVIDPLLFTFLDKAVDWAEELQIHLILDNHTFDPIANTDPNVGIILEKVWKQMATHYKDRSHLIYYEVLNEPHGITNAQWNNIQQGVINAIRTIDTKHTIIVGATNYNSYSDLQNLPVYADNNLIYTFHFYDPFLFTHQGASWVSPSMEPLANMPFPYQADKMPALPSSFNGTWIQSAFNNYSNDGTVAKVKQLIDVAVAFKTQRNVPVYCGEFGVYQPNSQEDDRVEWYDVVRKYLEEKGIAWTMWDYHGGFGLFEEGGHDLFDHDLNVPLLEAVGFDVPEQTEYVPQPEEEGFIIYDDFIGKGIFEGSYGSEVINYYAAHQPNNDDYCIHWAKVDRYGIIGLDFRPDKDLSQLATDGYALDLFVRGDIANSSFNIRLIDSDTDDPNDHPWRMIKTVNATNVPMDKKWYHLRIPLQGFTEEGAWENSTWYNPEGKFDWTAIDRLEFVADFQAFDDENIWLDNIMITNQDTAKVLNTNIFEYDPNPPLALEEISNQHINVFPNPMLDRLVIEGATEDFFRVELVDSFGKLLDQHDFTGKYIFDTSNLAKGFYMSRIIDLLKPKS
jgi:endoglucanase